MEQPEIPELCVNLCKLMDYSSFVKPLNSPGLPSFLFSGVYGTPAAKKRRVARDKYRNNGGVQVGGGPNNAAS